MSKYEKLYHNTFGFLMTQKEVTQQDVFTNILIFEAMDILYGIIDNYDKAIDEILFVFNNEQKDCDFENLCWTYIRYFNNPFEILEFRDCWFYYYNEC